MHLLPVYWSAWQTRLPVSSICFTGFIHGRRIFFRICACGICGYADGKYFAMPFYYLAVNYLWIGCMKMVQNISSLICYGVSDTWTSSQTSRLSPLDYLIRNLVMGVKYDKDYVQAVGVTISGGKTVAVYAVAAVVITVLRTFYKNRKIETTGDVVSIAALRPVFRWISGICGGGLIALAVSALVLEYIKVNEFISLMIFMVILEASVFCGRNGFAEEFPCTVQKELQSGLVLWRLC